MAACSGQNSDSPPTESVAKPDNELMRVISGEVLYRERMMLPPGATVHVVLEDQSRMDVAATPITDYTLTAEGGPPYPFRLVYAPDAVDPRLRYGVRAKIEHEGTLLFTSTEHIDPFARDPETPLQIVVTRVGQ